AGEKIVELPNVAFRAKSEFAVRMGLRYVKSLPKADWEKITAAAAARPFASLDDFVARADLNERLLAALSEAGAFERFGIGRPQVERGVVHLIAGSLWKPALSRTPAASRSHDFH